MIDSLIPNHQSLLSRSILLQRLGHRKLFALNRWLGTLPVVVFPDKKTAVKHNKYHGDKYRTLKRLRAGFAVVNRYFGFILHNIQQNCVRFPPISGSVIGIHAR